MTESPPLYRRKRRGFAFASPSMNDRWSRPSVACICRSAIRSLFYFAVVVGGHEAVACQVPVFRYALERWNPSEYRIGVPAKPETLSDSQRRALSRLRAIFADTETPLNARLEEEPSLKDALRLRFPEAGKEVAARNGFEWELSEAAVGCLVDSPVREELRKRLLSGESAVWVLLKSGDSGKDAAAQKALREGIEEAQRRLKLPEGATAFVPGETSASQELLERLPLRIAFSMVPLERGDSRELALIRLLLGVEADLAKYEGEPMAFAVFGRGRVLEPLIGAGIRVENFLEQSAHLCGACSCEVKEQNPGLDLLMRAQWNPLDTTPKIEIVRMDPATGSASSSPSDSPRSRWMVWGAALGLMGAVVFVVLKPSSTP